MKESLVEQRQIARKKTIFVLIKNNNSQLSRNDICKITKFSMTTVSAIVDEWIRDDFLFEAESSENRIGRRPMLLSINPNRIYFAGIECSSSGANLVITNAGEEIIYHDSILFEHPDTKTVLDAMDGMIAAFSGANPKIWAAVPSLTVSIPGVINTRLGLGVSYSGIHDWVNVPIREHFAYLGKQLVVMNNADSMLLGYCAKNNIPAESAVLFVLIRNGVGVRLFSRGTLLSKYGVFCEFGHLKASGSNRLCYCGKRGCYDTEITSPAIRNKMKEAVNANKLTSLPDRLGEEPDLSALWELVQSGDRDACEIYDSTVEYLADLLGSVFLMFKPDRLVLCTELCHARARLEAAINARFSNPEEIRAFDFRDLTVDYLLPSGEFAALGGAVVGFNRYFEVPATGELDL